ncbi:MAG TPA: condensation domain-containing protein, partial [Chitinophagaceae bacterium]|nr:condensation domain-containing protein [Chitinophagaceae bacterium]
DPDVTALLKDKYAAPRNEAEQALVSIWQELLNIQRIGIHDNFFELGGHSLLATRVISAIRVRLQLELAIKDLFLHPTVADLAACMREKDTRLLLPPITAIDKPRHIPLSFAQERLWFIHQLEGSVQYHLHAALRLKGALNLVALQQAIQHIINRHEVLRTVILENEGSPYQHVLPENRWQLEVTGNSVYENNAQALQEHIQSLLQLPFDLQRHHMLRAHLLKLNIEEHLLVLVVHHIAADGWSTSIIVKELSELYTCYAEGTTPSLPLLPVQYADYALWQRKYLDGPLLQKKIEYWQQKLQGITPLQLPTDHTRPAVQSIRGSAMAFSIEPALARKIKELSRQQGATLYMTLLAAFKVLLYRYTGQEDICVGTSSAGRQWQETEQLIGFFINTLALRSKLSSDLSFTDLLQQVRSTTLEAYEHQDAPFEKVVEAVVKERDPGRSPVFQVLFTLQNTPEMQDLRLGDVLLHEDEAAQTTTQFELNISIVENQSELRVG